jgi:hypothetical protein
MLYKEYSVLVISLYHFLSHPSILYIILYISSGTHLLFFLPQYQLPTRESHTSASPPPYPPAPLSLPIISTRVSLSPLPAPLALPSVGPGVELSRAAHGGPHGGARGAPTAAPLRRRRTKLGRRSSHGGVGVVRLRAPTPGAGAGTAGSLHLRRGSSGAASCSLLPPPPSRIESHRAAATSGAMDAAELDDGGPRSGGSSPAPANGALLLLPLTPPSCSWRGRTGAQGPRHGGRWRTSAIRPPSRYI